MVGIVKARLIVVVSFPGGAATSSLALFTGQDPIPGTIGKRSFQWSW